MSPTRRTVLESLAGLAGLAALAGCSGGSSEPTETLTPAAVPTRTAASSAGPPGTRLAFDRIDPRDVPAGAPIAVLSPEWRRWFLEASDGETVREGALPEVQPYRPAMDHLAGVRLQGPLSAGTYDLSLETGPWFEFQLVGEPVDDPPEDATVYPLEDLHERVRDRFLDAIEHGRVEMTPEMRAAEFHAEHGRPADGSHRVLYVSREGAVYRLDRHVPTVTPPEAFYVILRLSPTDHPPVPAATLDLRVGEDAAAPLREGIRASENGERLPLSAYPAAARELAVRVGYVATLTAFYRLRVEN